MIKVTCDRCGDDCDLNAYVITVDVIHNPNPVHNKNTGDIRLTDDPTHTRFVLCQQCYTKCMRPNPHKPNLEFKNEKGELITHEA